MTSFFFFILCWSISIPIIKGLNNYEDNQIYREDSVEEKQFDTYADDDIRSNELGNNNKVIRLML